MIDTNAAKKEIFSSIRQNLAASRPFDAVYNEHHPPTEQVVATSQHERSASDLLSQFRINLEAVAGKCMVVSSEREAAAAIQEIIGKLKPQTIVVSDSSVVSSLIDQINADVTVLKNTSKNDLFDCNVGITGAQWAIAETGTLVLESEAESNRLTSLIPSVHICLLDAKKIRQTMREVLECVKQSLNPAVTFITGPSRTSDIELTLAIGVHGPRELHVIVIDSHES